MTTLILNEKLLTVLTAIKSRQELAIIETSIDGFSGDWLKVVREYFYALPKPLMHELGLKRNERCIRAIERFDIPAEWLNTDFEELEQFVFSY